MLKALLEAPPRDNSSPVQSQVLGSSVTQETTVAAAAPAKESSHTQQQHQRDRAYSEIHNSVTTKTLTPSDDIFVGGPRTYDSVSILELAAQKNKSLGWIKDEFERRSRSNTLDKSTSK